MSKQTLHTQEEILTKLKEDTHYYGAFGKKFISNSDIKALLKNPKKFQVPQEDSKSFAVGRYFHQSILEPDKAKDFPHIDVATRNNKAYREICESLNKSVILLTKEKQHVDEMVQTMKANIRFFDAIYAEGNKFEVPAVGKIMGIDFKGKADIECDNFLIDLKSTADVFQFRYSANNYGYDTQAYIYQVLFGKPLIFYTIDKTTLLMGKHIPSPAMVERGKEKVLKAIQVYERFYGENAQEDVNQYFVEEVLP
jgi:hypothetical protein